MRNLLIVLGLVQVVFLTSLHCNNCARKIEDNVSFEKGVKDLSVSVPDKTVTITFNPAKTDTATLRKSINSLGYKAKAIEYKKIK